MKYSIILIFFLINNIAYAFDNLKNGISVTEENRDKLSYSSNAYAVADLLLLKTDKGLITGYFNSDIENELYALSSGNIIYNFDEKNEKLLGNWPLTRWKYQYFSPFIISQYKETYSRYPLPFKYERVTRGPGCLGDTPLRYGDIEEDGKKELVIILGNLFMVFSPEYKRIVFAEYMDESDWFNAQERKDFFGDETEKVFQYVSRFAAENNDFLSGSRAYAKLYFGDFDKDGNSDIIAWRKSYISKAFNDPVKGFTKKEDSWQHFKRDLKAQADLAEGVTGEYLPQPTDAETIQGWLTENSLTWSKGYPDLSECQGEEGKLIPEMHDPLLNDPDVLK
ncbi:MAG TPA: hypothetical protein ENJ08_05040 [Gammaproteobacteria bacterium]|nr:hypothetical protein [Gammaproteobacteria bacterium]